MTAAIDLTLDEAALEAVTRGPWRHGVKPPPVLTLSEWADSFRVLSRVASAEPGRWRTARAPYQRGILDACSDPTVERVVIMKSAQVGYTEILNNVVGFYMHQDPAPMLMVQPGLDMARAWSTDRLTPMLRESPALAGLVVESNRRHSGDTILHKQFPGGHLTAVGANAPAGLASRPIRVALFDEVDRFPDSAGDEGDPITLGIRRTTTFWNRKLILGSTPTLKGMSRIEAAWLESDQRRYYVPCPDCQHRQTLVWANLKTTDDGPRYACEGCGTLIGQERQGQMLAGGEWVVTNPGSPVVGFHLNALYSPWARWGDLLEEWWASQHNPARLQVFVNTILGEPWEERIGGLDPLAMQARAEKYLAPVPVGVGVVTAGVDVQDTRLEVTRVGWGHGEEAWVLAHDIIHGDPGANATWEALDQILLTPMRHAGGGDIPVMVACVDSGAHTQHVYDYCGPRWARRIYAVKGGSTPGAPLLPRRASRNNKGRVPVYLLGTNAAKDLLHIRLRSTVPGAGYLHTPHDLPADWYEQVVAEQPVRRQVQGRWLRRWELPRGRRNEALDCLVYALAALHLAPLNRARLAEYAAQWAVATPEAPPEPPPPPPVLTTVNAAPFRPRGPNRGGWFGRY